MTKKTADKHGAGSPGQIVRALRLRLGLTLTEVSERTGLAVSTLSKLERGHVSLSYDKLTKLSKGLGVDMAELLNPAPPTVAVQGGGRRVVHRAGEGQLVVTHSYRQTYLATELLNKRLVPMVAELRVSTMEEFVAEFGDFIRHPGEEFAYVLEGEVEFHTELYAPLRLKVGDSIYFDSEMGHAYLKGCEGTCKLVGACAPREAGDGAMEAAMKGTFERLAVSHAEPATGAPLAGARKAAPVRKTRSKRG